MDNPEDDRVCVGRITTAHGVRGLVKVQSFTDPPESLGEYQTVLDKSGAALGLELVGMAGGLFVGRLKAVCDRNAAERLRGSWLYVDRAALPETGEDEYYHADLVGLSVLSHTGEALGTVRSVENYGASDILDIKGQGRRDFMVPFTDAFVPTVDLDAGTVTLAEYHETE